MAQHEVTRTLVKSQPEVWAQCSVADSLERHMSGSFGEIRITRLEPEYSVAWEGEQVRGTVKIEPSAWGTRVTLAVELEEEAVPSPPPEESAWAEAQEPGPKASPAAPEPAAPPPRGRLARWLERLRRPPASSDALAQAPPELPPGDPSSSEAPLPEPSAVPDPVSPPATAALNAALESLGQAHHRPFSRA